MGHDILTPEKGDWDRFWQKDSSKQFSKVSWSKRRIIRVLTPYVSKGKTALDAGCGSGFFSKFFCDQGLRTVSLDYSDGALEMARKVTEGRTEIVKADLLKTKALSDLKVHCDLIFTDGLFEHFSAEDQDRIMQNLISKVSDEGVIVTFVPNRFSPWELIRPLYMPGIEEKPFVLKELIDLNVRNGLNVIESGGVNTLPFSVSLEGKIAKTFGMLLFTVARKRN